MPSIVPRTTVTTHPIGGATLRVNFGEDASEGTVSLQSTFVTPAIGEDKMSRPPLAWVQNFTLHFTQG